ncbi:MAG TPA: PDZ domain-containing protein [Polyangiaceae bacterium]|nr:PDZ domain-containing protein [Polyangiaceae bacterium]
MTRPVATPILAAMRLRLLPVLLVAACSPAAPSTRTAPPARVVTAAQAWANLCEGTESMPMEIAGSREFVRVTLPGAKVPGPLRFHVDTGGNTPGLMLLGSEAARIGFTSADALPHTIGIGGRDVAVPPDTRWVLLDAAGPQARFENALRRDYAVGQLGAGFLSRFVVCIDPAKQRMGLGDPRAYDVDPGGAAWLPLFMLQAGPNHALYPFLRASLGKPEAPTDAYGLLLDTGATTSMLERDKLDAERQRHPDWPVARGAFGDADMIGGAWNETVLRAASVEVDSPSGKPPVDLGPATFVDRPTGTWSKLFGDVPETRGSHGALANDVLLRLRLLIDYPHARLYVQPAGRAEDRSASPSRVGVSLVFDGADGCARISRITDTNAPATLAALRVGDAILGIDGHDACKLWHHELAALLAGPPGATVHLRLRREGRVIDADAVAAELLRRPETR